MALYLVSAGLNVACLELLLLSHQGGEGGILLLKLGPLTGLQGARAGARANVAGMGGSIWVVVWGVGGRGWLNSLSVQVGHPAQCQH